jgi:hypothetical protein
MIFCECPTFWTPENLSVDGTRNVCVEPNRTVEYGQCTSSKNLFCEQTAAATKTKVVHQIVLTLQSAQVFPHDHPSTEDS